MTAFSSRLIRFGEGHAVRVRLVSTIFGLTAEFTQLTPCEGGMEAETARVRVPLTHLDELGALMVSAREDAEALAARQPRRSLPPTDGARPKRTYRHAVRDQRGEEF